MYCEICGAEIPSGASFCANCGATVSPAQYGAPVTVRNDTPVIAPKSVLTMGILALALCWFGVPGIVLGAIGKNKAKSYVAYYGETTGQVKAGSITSKWGLALGIVFTIYWTIIILAAIFAGM